MSSPPPGQFDKLATVAIQGGAVYGLTLLGQLQAVLDEGYTIVALSGTSAGAIVATLHWAGLSPETIRDQFKAWAETKQDGASDILALLGSERDGRGMSRRAVVKHIGRMNQLTGCLGLPLPLQMWPGGAVAADGLRRVGWRHGGVFPGDVFEERVNELVRRGLAEQTGQTLDPHAPLVVGRHRFAPGIPITFGALWRVMQDGHVFYPALTLTATDLTARTLLLIDSTDARFFQVPVAKAVRASGGFPLFFTPVPITLPDEDDPARETTRLFVDGGVICNFPAFVFGRERRANLRLDPIYLPFALRPWVNIQLQLKDAVAPPAAGLPSNVPAVFGPLFGLLSGGTRTILESLLAQDVPRATVCSCVRDERTPEANETGTGWQHKLLDFDKLDGAAVSNMFDTGKGVAGRTLHPLWFGLPPRARVQARMGRAAKAVAAAFGNRKNDRLQVRATLFIPQELELALVYHWGHGHRRSRSRPAV